MQVHICTNHSLFLPGLGYFSLLGVWCFSPVTILLAPRHQSMRNFPEICWPPTVSEEVHWDRAVQSIKAGLLAAVSKLGTVFRCREKFVDLCRAGECQEFAQQTRYYKNICSCLVSFFFFFPMREFELNLQNMARNKKNYNKRNQIVHR